MPFCSALHHVKLNAVAPTTHLVVANVLHGTGFELNGFSKEPKAILKSNNTEFNRYDLKFRWLL